MIRGINGIYLLTGFFTMLLISSFFWFARPQLVLADAPDSTQYRRAVQITNTGSALTNYQVLVTIDTATLISQGRLQSDCDDLRFQDSNDTTNLDYWIENSGANGCNTASTRVWVEVPSINANATKTIYLYYGNPSASAGSNGAATFPFFDDFDSFNSSIWTSTAGGSGYSISGGRMTITQGSVYTTSTLAGITQPGYIAEAQVAWANNDTGQAGLHIGSTTNTAAANATGAALAYVLRGSGVTDLYGLAATGSTNSYDIAGSTNVIGSMALNTRYILGTAVASSNIYLQTNRTTAYTGGSGWSATPRSFHLWLGYFSGSNAGTTNISDFAVDWVLVRQYTTTPPTVSVGAETGATDNYALRFYGNGVNALDQDRVVIHVDNPNRPADVGSTDFTIEFWMKAGTQSRPGATNVGCNVNQNNWINGNIIYDKDRFNFGRKYGLSLTENGRLAFGVVNNANEATTICGTSDLTDNNWHHVVVQRRSSDGQMSIYIDGVLERQQDGPDGDISYPDGAAASIQSSPYCQGPGGTWGGTCIRDPYIVLGAEKHDAGAEYPSYNGLMDELRISNTLRYGSNFTPPTSPFTPDSNTMALYSFDEGTGTTLTDRSGATGGPSNGTLNVGGSPSGPAWVQDNPFSGGPTSTPSPIPSSTPTPTIPSSPTPTNTPIPTATPVPGNYPEGTRFRRTIIIDNSTGQAQTNLQIPLTLDTATLISTNKMQADCGDIRFRDTDQSTALDYWIENGGTADCNDTDTRVWVELPALSAGASRQIYVYYGNDTLANGSNGAATFPFFDDFDSFNSSIWTSTAGGSGYSQSGSTITITQGSIYTSSAVAAITQPGYYTEAQVRWTNNDAGQSGLNIGSTANTAGSNSTSAALAYHLRGNSASDLFGLAASGSTASYDIGGTSNIIGTQVTGTRYILGSLVTSSNVIFQTNRSTVFTGGSTWSATPRSFHVWLGYFNGQNAGTTNVADMEVDWVLVRRYAATMPGISIGSEVEASVPTAPSGLQATAASEQVSLSWNAPADNGSPITDYVVQYRPSGSGSFTTFADGTSTTTATVVTGLTNGVAYEFRVAAINGNGTSAYSATASATPFSATPAAPVASGVSVSGTARVGQILTGSYTYSDANGYTESGSTFRWLRSTTAGGTYTPIPGATASTYLLTETDATQYLRFEVTPRSAAIPTTGLAVQSTAVGPVDTVTYYNHILIIGQSFALGYDGNPALTTSQPYNNLKLNPTNSAVTPLIEDENLPNDNVNAVVESPASALGNTLTALSPGQSYRTLVSKSAVPGAAYSAMSKGTSTYNNSLAQITAGRSLIEAQGYEHRVVAIANLHGPADILNAASYEGYLDEWQQDYQADIFAITGQTGTLPMFIDQSSNFTAYNYSSTPLVTAQLSAAENNPDIYMVGPKYQFTYTSSDGIHLLNAGYRWLGEYYAKAIKRVVQDGETTTALMPETIVRNGNVISVKFDVPEPPIVIDTTNVLQQTDYGFEYADSGASADIDSVSIESDSIVRISLDTTPTGNNQRLRYAYTGTPGAFPGAQQAGSARGNIRDSDSTPSLYGNNLYNWLVHFDKQITVDETGPVLSNIGLSSPTSSSVRVTWNSSEPASGMVRYGLMSLSNNTVEENTDTLVTGHDMTVTGLASCTVYRIVARSRDLAQNQGESDPDGTVTTSGCIGSAVPAGSIVDTISNITGGELLFESAGEDRLRLNLTPGFSTGDLVIQAIQLNGATVLGTTGHPGSFTGLSNHIYELNALSGLNTEVTSFNQPVQLTFSYQNAEVSGFVESSLKIMRWNGSQWEDLNNNQVDTGANTVTATTTQFSTFGLFGQAISPTSTPVLVSTAPAPGNRESGRGSGRSGGTSQAPPCASLEPGKSASWLYAAVPLSPTSIKLLFSSAEGPVDHYALQFGTASGDYTFGASRFGTGETREYLVESLSPGKTYYFRVRGGNGCATGPWSNEITAKTDITGLFRQLQPTDIQIESQDREPNGETITDSPVSDRDDPAGPGELRSPVPEEQYTLRVRVIDSQRKPVPNVAVQVAGSDIKGVTDRMGFTELASVPSGSQTIRITSQGYTGEQIVHLQGDQEQIQVDVTVQKTLNYNTLFIYGLVGVTAVIIIIAIFRKLSKSSR
jgi:hypothetical protein